jgi:hypothetical protein
MRPREREEESIEIGSKKAPWGEKKPCPPSFNLSPPVMK